MEIETFYRCRIDYDMDDWSHDSAIAEIAAREHGVKTIEEFGSSPCCYPFFILESSCKATLERDRDVLVKLILSCDGANIEEG